MTTRVSKSKTETNATLLKSLLKLPSNKYCCDCKRADHPRWASWNLGIFLCIRCSGIHRSMGTHISRVKSVDLDAWTDEQTQSMVKWGNRKANKYWEAKLDVGHVPSEGKVDNFIKTKYVSRRWVEQDERPNPDDLSDEEESLAAKPSQASVSKQGSTALQKTAAQSRLPPAVVKPQPVPVDSLLGLDFDPVPAPAKSPAVRSPEQSLISQQVPSTSNLSLLSSPVETTPAAPASSTAPRNDLKMSIMSLYASAPKPQQYNQQYQQQSRPQQMSSQGPAQTAPTRGASAFDDLNGLFGGMNVTSAAVQPQRTQFSASIAQSSVHQKVPAATQQSQFQTQHQAATTTHSMGGVNDPWGNDDDSWGGFQGQAPSSSTKQTGAFDDLYSTSDVWK